MMDLERFEELWPQRDQVDSSLRAELEQMAQSNPDCKAFVEGGDWVRSMLLDVEPEKAPADFAYRMRVYAANHSEVSEPERVKSWMRWPVVVAGAALGVVVMVMTLSPMLQNTTGIPGMPGGMAETEEPADLRPAPASAPESLDHELLAASADSLAEDSAKTVTRDLPDYPVHVVSTGE